MPQVENFYGGREEGTDVHAEIADVLLGNKTLDDTQNPNVVLFVQHVWSNEYDYMVVERQWESIEVDEHGGTLDVLLVKGKTAVIYDYKNGTWPVKAENNLQLLCYAGIVAEHLDLNEFYGVIIQPNSKAKDKITVAQYPLELVESHRERVKAAANSDERKVGQHCLFCPLLQAEQCSVGLQHARNKGWTNSYKHLKALG